MKKMKLSIITLISLLCVSIGIVFIANSNTLVYASIESSSVIETNQDIIYLSDDVIDVGNNFTVKFNYGDVADYYYKENGVFVVDITTEIDYICFELKTDDGECNFELFFSYNGVDYIRSVVYTYATYGKVFIGIVSEDTVWRQGLDYKVQQGIITEQEAEEESDVYSRKYAQVIIKTQTEGITTYINGTYAKGKITWDDKDNIRRPLKLAKVELCYSTGLVGVLITTTYTNENGEYNISFTNAALGFIGAGYKIYIIVYAESYTFNVSSAWVNSSYYISSGVSSAIKNGSTTIIDINVDYNIDNITNKAFYVAQGMVNAQRYAMEVGGMGLTRHLYVAYPNPTPNTSTSFSFTIPKMAGVSGINLNDYNDWYTLMHEYGHFVQGVKNILGQSLWDYISKDPNHWGIEDMIYEKGYKEYGMQLSWSEAWAYVFAMMGYSYYKDEYGDIDSIIEWINGNQRNDLTQKNGSNENIGEANENTIVALLWDMFGGRNNYLRSDAWEPLGHGEFWRVSAKAGTYTFMDFAVNLNREYPQFKDQIGRRMSYFKIAPQDLTVTNSSTRYIPPNLSWRVNGSQYNPNNQFKIAFYDSNGVQKYETNYVGFILTANSIYKTRQDLYTASYTLSQDEWDKALSYFTYDYSVKIVVKGYLSGSPVSGPYWTEYKDIDISYVYGSRTVSGDFDGDGLDDIATFYDYGFGVLAIHVFTSNGDSFTYHRNDWLYNDTSQYDVRRITDTVVCGDFNGDGKDDIAAFYRYGFGVLAIHVFTSNGDSFTYHGNDWLYNDSVQYDANLVAGRVVSGDFNGDGKDDIAAFYNYGFGVLAIHVFTSNGDSFTYHRNDWLYDDSIQYDASLVTGRVVSGDFNGDGKDDIAAFYGYSGGRLAIHVFTSTGSSFEYHRNSWMYAEDMNYNVNFITGRVVCGDFNGDGKDDIAAFYNYRSGVLAIHVFTSNGSSFDYHRNDWMFSEEMQYNVGLITNRIVSGDFNGDGKDDIAAFYDYRTGVLAIHVFTSNGSSFDYHRNDWMFSEEMEYYLCLISNFQ